MNQRPCILVIDDDRDILKSVQDLLESEGFDVLAYSNGLDALTTDHAPCAPQLILLDLTLPDLDGSEFMRRKGSHPVLSTTPVLVFSATTSLPSKSAAIGADGYLRKPADIDDLLASVQRLMRKS